MAYRPYRALFDRHFEFTATPGEADFIVVGFRVDIVENARTLLELRVRRPDLRIVVVSEEPLWDTLWSGDYTRKESSVSCMDTLIHYTVLNHFTSRIFDFRSFPYFLTTTNNYFIRYRNLFLRNVKFNASEIRVRLSQAKAHNAFYCERRVDQTFVPKVRTESVFGLSVFRSELAEVLTVARPAIRVGKGWINDEPRQILPDWHLEKLSALDMRAQFTSGIENTHAHQYVTEKIFDAFATLSIPLYVADHEHWVHRLVSEGSFLNLFGLDAQAAAERIQSFTITNSFCDQFRETQAAMAELFGNPDRYCEEREIMVNRLSFAFAKLI